MYALFAYILGEWGIAGIDPHEECAAMFIETVDEAFGDGTAFVAKLPDKGNHSPIADAAQQHLHSQNMAELADTLRKLESDKLDLNEELRKLK